jgi:hypothetical protein
MSVKCFMVEMLDDTSYRSAETGETWPGLYDLPPGAMFWWTFATSEVSDWHPYNGPEGKCLAVMLPSRNVWLIDSDAKNCTDKEDFQRGGHKCWIRHGAPPLVTVDKRAGVEGASAEKTCGAGAGSIQSGEYHGFLRGGFLVAC